MTVTVSRLRSWQPAQLEEAADSLEVSRRRLDSTVGDLSIAVRMAEDGWQGDAAEAAVRTLRTHVRTGTELVETVNMVRRTLHAASDALAAARALLERALDLAADYHLLVTDAGVVRFSPLYVDPTLPSRADYEFNPILKITVREATLREAMDAPAPPPAVQQTEYRPGREAQIVLGEVQAMVRQALDAADEADRDAAKAVRAAFACAADGSTSDSEDRALVGAAAMRDVPAMGTDPRQVAAWWTTLSASAQGLLLARSPELIGMLDGVPASARDRANQVVLRASIDDLSARLAELEAGYHPFTGNLEYEGDYADEHDPLVDRLRMLQTVGDQLTAGPDRHLLLLDTQMPGRAAITIGDIDTADHVAVLVPGFGSAVTNYMPIITSNAAMVNRYATDELIRLGSGETVATVAWIGYHAPLGLDVASYGDAHDGATQLQSTLRGIDASRAATGGAVHLTTVGHSYGSTVSGLASQTGTPMDDLVVFGSPGVGVDSATQLDVGPGHVFIGAADDDSVSYLGRFGPDPTSPDFGGTHFQVNGGPHPSTPGVDTLPVKGHSQYYGPGTESLANIVSVVVGSPDNVTVMNPGERPW